MENFKRKPNTVCMVCAKPIYRRPKQIKENLIFCSGSCRGKYHTKSNTCSVCGKEIGIRNKTCSRTCSNIARAGIKYFTGQRKNKVKYVAGLKERLIQLRGSSCEICGFDTTKILVVHHVKQKAHGGSDDLENLQLICPNCHALIHWG